MDTVIISPVALLGGAGMILVAVGFIVYAAVRRLGWAYLGLGALAWIVTVALKFALAIPLNPGIFTALTGALPGAIGAGAFDLYVGLLTGLTEVLMVWLVMRYSRLGHVDWNRALAFGIGFGAVEALVTGLGSLASVSAIMLAPQSVPPAVLAQLAMLNNPLFAVAPIVERFFTIWVHIFSNVLIFFGVAKSQSRWFWLAFAFKSLLDALASFGQTSGMTTTLGQIWILEAGVMLFGVLSWLGVRWVEQRYSSTAERAPSVATGKPSRIKYVVAGIVVVLLVAGIIAAAVRSLPPAPITLSASAQASVLVYSEPEMDNLMAGLNANDYTAFTRDFDDRMKVATPPAQFANLEKTVVGKIGKYVSRKVDSVEQTGDFITVIYTAKFENDDPVTITVAFHPAEPHQIAGLHFNSAKLRQP